MLLDCLHANDGSHQLRLARADPASGPCIVGGARKLVTMKFAHQGLISLAC